MKQTVPLRTKASVKSLLSPELLRAFRFHFKHGGYALGQQAQGALEAARAELEMKRRGVVFSWLPDDMADWSWLEGKDEKGRYLFRKAYREGPHEVEMCDAMIPCEDHGTDCPHAVTLASMSGIFDADANYRRVVEAELALDVLANEAQGAGSTHPAQLGE